MGKTTIEWASHTWNPYTWACNKVSPGCLNCYAEAMTKKYKRGTFAGAPRWRGAAAMKELKKLPSGASVFVNSMSDTYHEGATLQMIHGVHAAVLSRPDVTFMVLTKRIDRAYYMREQLAWPPNLWIGTSVESADYLWRVVFLGEIPAAGRFISAEPLLGSLRGDSLLIWALEEKKVNWVIAGGESGANRRPFDPEWARELRDLCQETSVPFMFKQGSHLYPGKDRLLDGRTWDETPFGVVETIAVGDEPAPQTASDAEPVQMGLL